MSAPLTCVLLLATALLAGGSREKSAVWFGSPPSLHAKEPSGPQASMKKLQLHATAEQQPGESRKQEKLVLMQSKANNMRSASRGSDFADLLQDGYLETPTELPSRTVESNTNASHGALNWALAAHALAVPTDPTNSFHVGTVAEHNDAVGKRAHTQVCPKTMGDMYQRINGYPDYLIQHNVYGVSTNTGPTIIFRAFDDGYSKMVLTNCSGYKIKSGYLPKNSDQWGDTTLWQGYDYYIKNVRQVPEFLAQKSTSDKVKVDVGPAQQPELPLKSLLAQDSVGPWACAILLLALAATVLSLYAARVLDLVALSFVFAAAGFLATFSVVIYLTFITDIMWDSLAGKEPCPYCRLAAAWSTMQAVASVGIIVAVPHLVTSSAFKESPPPPPPPEKRFPRVDFPSALLQWDVNKSEDFLRDIDKHQG